MNHPWFTDTGPISECIVVFPRTSVRIRHQGSEPFLADPTVVTIYNRGQRYERFAVSNQGDRCDWFAVSDDVAREIAGTLDQSASDSDRPFRFERAASSPSLYFRQRSLMRQAESGELDLLEMEESVMDIVGSVLELAHRATSPVLGRTSRAVTRHRDIAEAARVELLRTFERNQSVADISAVVGASPYHLCRVFLAINGMTMHQYRTEIRLRFGLELLGGESGDEASLSAVAHRLGFSSHAHFVRATRRWLGAAPGKIRAELRVNDASSASVLSS